ncbi:hypothetical protein ACIGCK_13370 [Microbacterium sp. NPDC078428]|uniref:hypothetical protein n=1 Tax=Microbacterium sp. NPDC078428 TaxID=3364190 RepID=UPI0037C87EE4
MTLITALMYYFGLIHAYWFFAGFGVDYTLFELSPEDYILRSADGLLFPFSAIGAVVLALAWIFQLLIPRFRSGTVEGVVRMSVPFFSILGLGLMIVGGVAFLVPEWLTDYPALGGMALVFGVLLLTAATKSMRWLADGKGRPRLAPPTSWVVAEWSAVVVLVSVGLFWAVGDLSARVGEQRAEQVVQSLPGWPTLILYSERSLNLTEPGVTETMCSSQDAAFGYRYDGLVLITQEGSRLLLLPRTWSDTNGTAVVLASTDALRFEFSPSVGSTSRAC